MASKGKRKTTMAKLNRESKVREKKADKAARKEQRKAAAANGEPWPPVDPFLDSEGPSDGEGSDAAPAAEERAAGDEVPAAPAS